MTVRSKELWRAVAANTNYATVYTAPSGKTPIIRVWRFLNYGTSAILLDVALDDPATTNYIPIYQFSIAAKSFFWEAPYVVLPVGKTVRVRASIATLASFGWGVELEGVAP
jgi:hypothetical protein